MTRESERRKGSRLISVNNRAYEYVVGATAVNVRDLATRKSYTIPRSAFDSLEEVRDDLDQDFWNLDFDSVPEWREPVYERVARRAITPSLVASRIRGYLPA